MSVTERPPEEPRSRDRATITVAFWNRWRLGNTDAQIDHLRQSSVEWDVLVLAEVTRPAARRFPLELDADGLTWLDCVEVTDMRYPSGVCILTRGDLRVEREQVLLFPYAPSDARPRPERAIAATLSGWRRPLTILGWHAPYAAGRGRVERERNARRKQAAYVGVNRWIRAQDGDVVVGMDANTWDDPADLTAAVELGDAWDDERRFHSSSATHGLVDSLRSVLGPEDRRARHSANECLAVTHRVPSRAVRFDRIAATPTLRCVAAGVEAEPTGAGRRMRMLATSDHALVWATFQVAHDERPGSARPDPPHVRPDSKEVP